MNVHSHVNPCSLPCKCRLCRTVVPPWLLQGFMGTWRLRACCLAWAAPESADLQVTWVPPIGDLQNFSCGMLPTCGDIECSNHHSSRECCRHNCSRSASRSASMCTNSNLLPKYEVLRGLVQPRYRRSQPRFCSTVLAANPQRRVRESRDCLAPPAQSSPPAKFPRRCQP